MLSVNCPENATLSGFLNGSLSAAILDDVSGHLEQCTVCLERLTTLSEATASVSRWKAFAGANPDLTAAVDVAIERILQLEPLPAPRLAAGSRLHEYAILDVLGEGGMGTIYKARHTRLDKIVALKVIRPGPWSGADALARFEREMRAVGRLRNEYIVQATDAGEADGMPYLVMEFVDGVNLSRWIHEQGVIGATAARVIIRQAALGLHHAHEAGLIHRDVKPSNLMRTPDGGIKLLDLGLAIFTETPEAPAAEADTVEMSGDLTSPSRMIGTRDYMAPEQSTNAHTVDARADVYGLGGVLWYLLTGKPPGDGPAPAAIPGPVWHKLLAPDPNDRYSSAAEVAAAMAPANGRGIRKPALIAVAALMAVPLALMGFKAMLAKVPVSPPQSASIADTTPKPGTLPMTEPEAVALQKAWAEHLGLKVTTQDGFGQSWKLIPPGTVTLGISFQVTITKPYEMSATEITLKSFREFFQSTGHVTTAESNADGGSHVDFDAPTGQKFKNGRQYTWRTPGHGATRNDCPVTQVNHADARAYCEWLTAKTGRKHRLPTEAEWLWAYRAGNAGDPGQPYGKIPTEQRPFWILDTVGKPAQPKPVGLHQANTWGLHDLIGIVMEICDDEFAEYPQGAEVDYCRRGTTHQFYVIHGHCYYSGVCDVVNSRGRLTSSESSVGFRIVREIAMPPSP